MEIKKLTRSIVYHVEILNDENYLESYSRYGENNWWINIGNDSHILWDAEAEKLEELFKEFLKQ